MPDLHHVRRLADQFLPARPLGGIPAVMFLALLVSLIAGGLVREIVKLRGEDRTESSSWFSRIDKMIRESAPMWVVGSAAIMYLGLVWIAPLLTNETQPVVRIQAPAIPVLLIGALLSARLLKGEKTLPRWMGAALIWVVVGGAAVGLTRAVRSWSLVLTTAPKQEPGAKELDAAVIELRKLSGAVPPDCNIVTNAPTLVWYYLRKPTRSFQQDPRFVFCKRRVDEPEVVTLARENVKGLDYYTYSKPPDSMEGPLPNTGVRLFSGAYWNAWLGRGVVSSSP